MNRRSPVALILGILAAAPGCRREAQRPEAAGKAPVEVRVAAVEETSAGGAKEAPGIVAARQSADITARTAATLVGVFVHEGDLVREGQKLAELDSRDLEARIAAAKAEDRSASAEKERVDRLAGTGAATPREKEVASSSAAAARAALAEARAGLSYLRPAAPFSGRVTSVPVHAGDHVTPGQRLVLLESDSGFEVQAAVDGTSAPQLVPGRKVDARVDGLPQALPAVVRSLSPAGDPETHRFLLRADLPRDARLRSGTYAAVELPDASAASRRAVPASAIVERGGLTGVFVAVGEKAFLRWIAAGPREGNLVVVRSGLEPGEKVILSPGDLVDGAPVRIVER